MVALVAAAGVPGLASPSARASAGPDHSAARVGLPSPVPSWPAQAGAADDGPAGAGVTLQIRVYLAGRARAAALRLATAASDPGDPGYAHYLTPAQFAARFGPTRTQIDAVTSWARARGLHVTASTPHYLGMTGTAPAISRALGTSIHSYFSPFGGLAGYAPVEGMSLPRPVAGEVTTVTGLDSYTFSSSSPARSPASSWNAGQEASTIMAPSAAAGGGCSQWWGQHRSAIPATDGQTSAADAVCGYTPQQLRSAYGVTASSGRGATIAVVLDGHLASMQADANRFFADHHLPGFAPGQFTEDFGPGSTASCGAGFADLPEEPLDVETAHILAPDAKIVYVAASCGGTTTLRELAYLDAQTRIVDSHLADVETNSFSTVETAWTAAMTAAFTQVFQQGAAEGIGFTFDSGDGGDDHGAGVGGGTAVQYPASDPWATGVGGATTQIGRQGTITGQLGWGDTGAQLNPAGTGYLQPPPGDFYQGSTGGVSTLFPRPGYQRGVVAARPGTGRAAREVPDVAADASPLTGWLIGYGGRRYAEVLSAGTSGASPIIAALEADAKTPGGHAIGFANPLLYRLHTSPGIHDVLPAATPALSYAPTCTNDRASAPEPCVVTLGLDSTLHVSAGYDNVTGLGAATGAFIATLAQ